MLKMHVNRTHPLHSICATKQIRLVAIATSLPIVLKVVRYTDKTNSVNFLLACTNKSEIPLELMPITVVTDYCHGKLTTNASQQITTIKKKDTMKLHNSCLSMQLHEKRGRK